MGLHRTSLFLEYRENLEAINRSTPSIVPEEYTRRGEPQYLSKIGTKDFPVTRGGEGLLSWRS